MPGKKEGKDNARDWETILLGSACNKDEKTANQTVFLPEGLCLPTTKPA